MTENTIKTPEEIEALKWNWVNDPCWDIEDTEGFEAHHDELARFRQEREAVWEAKRQSLLAAKADELGIPGNFRLAQYVMNLEWRLKGLEEKLDNMHYAD